MAKPAPRVERPPPETEAERDARLLSTLPPPMQPLHSPDPETVRMWMVRCAEAGGIEALMWLYRPENWPHGNILRGKMQGWYGDLMRAEEFKAKARTEEHAQVLAASLNDAAREVKRAKGWVA